MEIAKQKDMIRQLEQECASCKDEKAKISEDMKALMQKYVDMQS